MKIVLKQNVANIVVGPICIAVEMLFIALVWITNASLGERMMITLMFGSMIVLSVLELLKAIYWRIVMHEDGFTFRNRWGKETSYSFDDICFVKEKGWYFVIKLVNQRITVEYRSVNNCMYLWSELARRKVNVEVKT